MCPRKSPKFTRQPIAIERLLSVSTRGNSLYRQNHSLLCLALCPLSQRWPQTFYRAGFELRFSSGDTGFISRLFLDTCQICLQQPFSHFSLALTFRNSHSAQDRVHTHVSVYAGRASRLWWLVMPLCTVHWFQEALLNAAGNVKVTFFAIMIVWPVIRHELSGLSCNLFSYRPEWDKGIYCWSLSS